MKIEDLVKNKELLENKIINIVNDLRKLNSDISKSFRCGDFPYIKGTNNQYKITDSGVIFCLLKNKIIKQTNMAGYKTVWINKDGSMNRHRVHKLVMESYFVESDL